MAGTLVLAAACCAGGAAGPAANVTPRDSQHQGITTPHGDHSAHHGGLVLMNGELHYEVVFDRDGRHRVWFSDAVREDLPASIGARRPDDGHPAQRTGRDAPTRDRRSRRELGGSGPGS